MAMIRQLDMGWDSNGAQEFITQLRTNVIANTKADLEAHGQIMTALENGWIGENKDIFVANFIKQIQDVERSLDAIEAAAVKRFNELETAMSEIDHGIVGRA